MSLELNPKRNRFGRFGRLRRRGVAEKKPSSSGSSGESSNYDTLETAPSLDISAYAYAPLYGKLDPKP